MSSEDSDARFARFGRMVHRSLTVDAPFGSLSKGELELAVFSALVGAELVDSDDRPFRLAKALRCTPTRASSLVFNYRLRTLSSDPAKAGLLRAIRVVEDNEAAKHNQVILNVEDRFWREVLIDELKNHDVFTDSSFNRERLVLSAKSFVSACEKVFGDEGEKIAAAVRRATKDGKKRQPGEVIQSLVTGALGGAAKAAGSAAARPTIEFLASSIT
ncbi:hypothetical protein [Nocardioides lacusdianchii]|uniref:hypothetical protein n=1 Tax=Nocardioides lacusdianchii TaxID=2783664 RepID=UPI001CD03D19|nr:hypothetical protein [Nocardioides lacusdianchii]